MSAKRGSARRKNHSPTKKKTTVIITPRPSIVADGGGVPSDGPAEPRDHADGGLSDAMSMYFSGSASAA